MPSKEVATREAIRKAKEREEAIKREATRKAEAAAKREAAKKAEEKAKNK